MVGAALPHIPGCVDPVQSTSATCPPSSSSSSPSSGAIAGIVILVLFCFALAIWWAYRVGKREGQRMSHMKDGFPPMSAEFAPAQTMHKLPSSHRGISDQFEQVEVV